jgi:hypothetical protein
MHSTRLARFVVVLSALAFGSIACAPIDEMGDEPDEGAIAVDEIQRGGSVECDGPFNCKLPNHAGRNANRYDNPTRPDGLWVIHSGARLRDGFGNIRGTILSPLIAINYGQRKRIDGMSFVYAFAVQVTGYSEPISGWILESSVQGPIDHMPTVSARNPGLGDYDHTFWISGGDPTQYGDLKVMRNYTGPNGAAADYLVRPGNVVNLLYALPGVGGVSTDTLPIGRGTPFHRSRGVASVSIPLFQPGTSTVATTMRFIYGHVGTRWGWIARDALRW